jgi:membrane protein
VPAGVGAMTSAQEREWQAYWHTAEQACRRTVAYTQGRDLESFERDDLAYDAIVRNLDVVEHAAAGVPQDLRLRLSERAWRTMAGFDALVSDSLYRNNHSAVWSAATVAVPSLLEEFEAADIERVRVSEDPEEHKRGRRAAHPGQIPRLGWRDIGWRVLSQMSAHNLFVVAAGVAFYGLLSLFPALATMVSIYGLMFDAADVQQQLTTLAALLPLEAWDIIEDQLTRITGNPATTLSISAIVGLLLTLWSARAGVGALMIAMNIVYNEEEKRGLVEWFLLSLLLTIGAILYTVLALALIVALPALLGPLGLEATIRGWVSWLRWPLLAISTMVGLSIIYRYGPSRRAARWVWVSWGAVVATLFWLLGSLLFSVYIANFGNFNETYGSLGAVIVLMLWFYVSAFIVLVGAELDAETEHQTAVDSTIGPPRPMGERGAHVADTLGRRP